MSGQSCHTCPKCRKLTFSNTPYCTFCGYLSVETQLKNLQENPNANAAEDIFPSIFGPFFRERKGKYNESNFRVRTT